MTPVEIYDGLCIVPFAPGPNTAAEAINQINFFVQEFGKTYKSLEAAGCGRIVLVFKSTDHISTKKSSRKTPGAEKKDRMADH